MTVVQVARRGSLRRRVVAAAAALVRDTFARTSTTSPGTAQTGQAWTANAGTWGPDGTGMLSRTAADGDTVTIDGGQVNQDVTVTLDNLTGSYFARLWLRYVNAFSGLWLETQSGGSTQLIRNFTQLGPTITVPSGAVIRVWHREVTTPTAGTRITVWVNGTQVIDVTDTDSGRPQVSRMGFRHGASGAATMRWRDLTIAAG